MFGVPLKKKRTHPYALIKQLPCPFWMQAPCAGLPSSVPGIRIWGAVSSTHTGAVKEVNACAAFNGRRASRECSRKQWQPRATHQTNPKHIDTAKNSASAHSHIRAFGERHHVQGQSCQRIYDNGKGHHHNQQQRVQDRWHPAGAVGGNLPEVTSLDKRPEGSFSGLSCTLHLLRTNEEQCKTKCRPTRTHTTPSAGPHLVANHVSGNPHCVAYGKWSWPHSANRSPQCAPVGLHCRSLRGHAKPIRPTKTNKCCMHHS